MRHIKTLCDLSVRRLCAFGARVLFRNVVTLCLDDNDGVMLRTFENGPIPFLAGSKREVYIKTQDAFR